MEQAIRNFSKQFEFDPIIENERHLKSADSYVVCGMGGSHLSSGLMKIYDPSLDIYIHRDYDLPKLAEKRFRKSLYIASSFSGNTEEVVDFAEKAFESKYNLAIVAKGGKLIDFAKAHKIPFIQLPQENIQPRIAIGLSFLALARFMGGEALVSEIQELGKKLDPQKFAQEGDELARGLKDKIPVVYSSRTNQAIAYNWKIKFNESAKIPAFHNVFPELNHNEMTGFDVTEKTKDLSSRFHFVFLADSDDEPRIMKRMEVLKNLFERRGLSVASVMIPGSTVFEKMFNSLILADWTALGLSKIYGTDPEQVPMVEEFKKLIA